MWDGRRLSHEVVSLVGIARHIWGGDGGVTDIDGAARSPEENKVQQVRILAEILPGVVKETIVTNIEQLVWTSYKWSKIEYVICDNIRRLHLKTSDFLPGFCWEVTFLTWLSIYSNCDELPANSSLMRGPINNMKTAVQCDNQAAQTDIITGRASPLIRVSNITRRTGNDVVAVASTSSAGTAGSRNVLIVINGDFDIGVNLCRRKSIHFLGTS
jgi:hypothetical protein